MQDATGNWGGSLIFSTTTAGSTGQLVDRLVIDSTGLATLAGGALLSGSSTSLTVQGSTVLGSTSSQTLTVNAASSFAATASFTGNTSLTASGNVALNGGSSKTLTVQATSSFSAPVTVNSTMNVSGLGTFTGGVALSTPVTVNGVPLATVATTGKYLDLIGEPRFYAGSSSYATNASGAPTQPAVITTWYGTVAVSGSSGVATARPTSDGTATGTALFTSILSVSATAYAPSSSSAITVPTAAVTGISSDLRTVNVTAIVGQYVLTVLAGGNNADAYAASGTQLMCTIVGLSSS